MKPETPLSFALWSSHSQIPEHRNTC